MKGVRLLLFFVLVVAPLSLLFVSCANMGAPDGGRYDEEPPYVVKALPAESATSNTQKKITISFNEYIKIENASEKVVVSPPQIEMPHIEAVGKKIKVTLNDSLKAATTYTIDFGDAIVDNNEGNPMGQYTYSFSTGEKIDTLQVSGNVLTANNLEPVKGILVGLYNVNDTLPPDSLFTCSPMRRISRTNGSGRFSIKGVSPGTYRIFALQDMDGNYHFSQKSEMVAFDTIQIEPGCTPDTRFDSIFSERDGQRVFDSLKTVHYTRFYPDDVVLTAFLESGQSHYRLKEQREEPLKFTLYFTAPADSLPVIKGLNFDDTDAFTIEHNATLDTITYWIRDTLVAYQDTLAFAMTYLMTDTLGQLVPATDTLELVPKVTRQKQLAELAEKNKEWEKQQKKARRKMGADFKSEENPNLVKWIEPRFSPGNGVSPNENLTLEFPEPIEEIDTAAIRFELKVDTLWTPAPFFFERVEPKTHSSIPTPTGIRSTTRRFCLYAEWRPGNEFRLTIDSMAIKSLYGLTNKRMERKIKVRSLDEFGALFVVLHTNNNADTAIVVQLLNRSDKVVVQQLADKNGHADFFYLKPGEYYLRCFIDRNGNNEWDTGEIATGRQPEEVFYFPQALSVRAKWEMEQDWDIRGIERTKQKPAAITKQKPDKEKKIKDRNAERAKKWKK